MNLANISSNGTILNLTSSVAPQQGNLDFNIAPYLPLVGILGPISYFLYQNRPRIIDKREIANYINYETNTRYHEYSLILSWGHDKIPWDYLPILREIKSAEILKNTKTEFYYLTQNTGEVYVPKDCLKIKHGKRQRFYFVNMKKFREEQIETVYLITKDIEESSYQMKINEERYPNDNFPEKIMLKNENKINIQNYIIKFTKQQSDNLLKRNHDYTRYLRWKNVDVADSFVENNELKIVVKDIPKKHGEHAGTTIIDLL